VMSVCLCPVGLIDLLILFTSLTRIKYILKLFNLRVVSCHFSSHFYEIAGNQPRLEICGPVASLGWVTPGAATEGVTPLFFPEKSGDLFLVASSAVSPLVSSSQNLTTFFCSLLSLSPSAFYRAAWNADAVLR